MICLVCQSANEEDANFCLHCNHRLVIVCPRCSRRVNSRANYCDRCGLTLNTPYQGEIARPDDRPANILSQPNQVATQTTKLTRQPVEGPTLAELKRSVAQAPAVVSALAHYIPAELMHKLERARLPG